MRERYLRKLCINYLLAKVLFSCFGIILFSFFAPLPAIFNLFFILLIIIPAIVMLLLVVKYSNAFLYVKSKFHYVLITQITVIALFANGIESITLLLLMVVPALACSLDEEIVIPSCIILFIFSFFAFSYYNPALKSILSRINILSDNSKFCNVNSAYIILYYLLFIAQFFQSQYYGKMQNSYTNIITEKNKLLKLEKQFKENILIYAAHEIKNPHTIIKNNLDKLSLSYPELQKDPYFIATMGEVNRVIKDAINIFDEETSYISRSRYDHDNVFSLSCFLKEKALLFSSYARAKGITVISEDIESNLYIKAADEAIDRVINNLLDNAIKYTPKGGEVRIIAKASEDKIELVIEDNGIGIPSESVKNVFTRYYQITKREGSSRGIGLGLFLVKNILDSLEATVEIETEENRGTAFRIKFERYFAEPDTVSAGYSISEPAFNPDRFVEVSDTDYKSSLPTILIVEDEVVLLRTLMNVLKDDYNIITATDGQMALDKLEKTKVNLILSDIVMPVMNGIDFCKEIKSQDEYKEIPFIFVTAGTKDIEKIKCLQLGAIDYIPKPFNFTEIELRLKNYLKLHDLVVKSTRVEMINELENNYQEKIDRLPTRLKEIANLLYHQPFITNREIADNLHIKPGSVGGYIKDIARKFDLRCERKCEVIGFLRKYRNN